MGQEVDENDSSEGAALVRELKREGVDTRYCRFWEGASVPSAWVLEAGVCVYFSPSPFLFFLLANVSPLCVPRVFPVLTCLVVRSLS